MKSKIREEKETIKENHTKNLCKGVEELNNVRER